ncbi:MAG TPA: hypothetical protein VFD06_15710 [Candidatus Polarisedimenticolia bacterium]|nr:hypothetical protein [Candidatus Polarisedimenticolia bacterium]
MRRPILIASMALLLVPAGTAIAQRRPDLLADRCVLRLPGMDKVVVRTGLPFKTAGDRRLAFDLYLPPESSATALDALIRPLPS